MTGVPAITLLREQLEPVLRDLAADRTGGVIQEFRPRSGDYALVFVPSVVDEARQRYEDMWAGPLNFRHPEGELPELVASLAPAGKMTGQAPEGFPAGYCSIAHLLLPHRIWAAWRYLPAGRPTGLAYNGLVWCDDHWAWLPKPYLVLAG